MLLHGQPLLSTLSSWHWSLCNRVEWTSELFWMRLIGHTGGIDAIWTWTVTVQFRFCVSQYGYRSACICTWEWHRKDWRKLKTCNFDLQLELRRQINGREWDVWKESDRVGKPSTKTPRGTPVRRSKITKGQVFPLQARLRPRGLVDV